MTLNFFTSENGFQKSLIDPSVAAGNKKDYTTSLKREEFSTSRSKSNHVENDNDKNNDKFSDMMNRLKEKTNNNRVSQSQTTVENLQKDSIAISTMDQFKTVESATNIPIDNVISETEISLANIASLNAEIQRLIEAQTSQSPTKDGITATVDDNPDETKDISSLLASFLRSNDGETDKEENLTLISILKNIQDIASADDAAAMTSGLTLEQLSTLQENIQNYMNDTLAQDDQKELEAIAAQWVSLSPLTKDNGNGESKEKDSLTLISTKADTPTQKEPAVQTRFDSRYDARYDDTNNTSRNTKDADVNARDFKADMKNAQAQSNGNATTNNQTQSAGQRFLQTAGLTSQPQIATSDIANPAVTGGQNNQMTIQSSLTNVITQSQAATQSHPATQMVSATIQKAVKAGEDTNIKLRLDPPELGRVEVKMSIDKDNTTKVVLTVEKPETYLMLKQDAEALERALNNAGLETDGELSFELASEDHDFNQDREQTRGSRQNNNSNDLSNEDVIETSMDWQVDKQTGQMHYNVMV